MSILPVSKSQVTRSNPKVFLVYAPPKAGKTSLFSTLPNNLMLDLEEGTDYVEALAVKIIGWSAPVGETPESIASRRGDLVPQKDKKFYVDEVGRDIIANGRPYDFITIDTISVLEDLILPLANAKYKSTPMGSSWTGTDVKDLPRGAGYYYLRLAFKEAIDKIKKLADNIILIGHLKDTMIDKAGKEVAAKDIDLTGKIKIITCADADAIGYLHRGNNNELLINFKSSDELNCGSRCPHLRGQEIKIADYDEKTNSLINIDWGLIYPDTFKSIA